MSTMRIAILQAPAPDFSRAEEGWQALLSRIDDAAQDGPQLIVLPEASYEKPCRIVLRLGSIRTKSIVQERPPSYGGEPGKRRVKSEGWRGKRGE